MRWPWQRRQPIQPAEPDIEDVPTTVEPRPADADNRLFLSCTVCRCIFFASVIDDGTGSCTFDDCQMRCPNGHWVTFSTPDLFYLDGTRPRKASR